MNTQEEIEHIEYLLNKENYLNWINNNANILWDNFMKNPNISAIDIYIMEHGLPTGSIIKGL